MYKTTINIETQLHKIAVENCEYNELWSTWNLNKKTLEPVLNAIIKDYPHYSLHDHSHSESILLNIERLLGNNNIEMLSPTDLWLLLHVSYLHDFGMVILDSKIHEFWAKNDFQNFLKEQSESADEDANKAANIILNFENDKEKYSATWPLEIRCAVTLLISIYCRWQHASYSQNYILDIDKMWGIAFGHNGLIKKRFISLLADISAMHTKSFEDVFTLPKESNGFKNDYMHPRLIACLLRLGDVLDLDNSRFNRYGEKIFGKMPENSKVHYTKHESTKHVLITNEIIEVEADCPTDEIYRETRKWYDSLKSEIDNLHLNWNDIAPKEFNYPPKLKPYKILRNGIEDSRELSNLKFSISQSKAFEILEGFAIYKDKFSCIREIIQNAEDATKIQLWRDIKSGMYYSTNGIDKSKVENGELLPNDIPEWVYQIYSIQITIEKNDDNNATLSIIDHGTGISIDTLKSICNVGQSYFQRDERKQEIEDMPIWLRPTANFGIGLQSCFMVTDKIIIYTNSNNDGAYKLTFKSGKQEGYVNVESIQDFNARGSKIVIEVENNLNFSYSSSGFTAENLKNIEPFETNCFIIYKLIESIYSECASSFFDINVISQSIDFSDSIKAYIYKESRFPTKFLNNDILYDFDNESGTITYWYDNNLYKISPVKDSIGYVKVKFKGKYVHETSIPRYKYIGFIIDVDIYGISAKEALSLNREKLNFKSSSKINKDLKYLIGNYFEILINKDDINNTDMVDVFMLNSYRFDKEFPKKLHHKVSSNKTVRILRLKNNKEKCSYEIGSCSLSEIADEYPYIPYINYDIVPEFHPRNYASIKTITEQELIKVLEESEFDIKQKEILIIDNLIKQFLSLSNSDKIYLNADERIAICRNLNINELYNPNDYTKSQLISDLVFDEKRDQYYPDSIMRRSIPAFNEFSKLAVDTRGLYFIGYNDYSKWNIISPISLKDSEKINEFSKEAFVNYIIEQPVFENIVQYVSEHGKEKSSKEVIISEYKRLTERYYDIVKS